MYIPDKMKLNRFKLVRLPSNKDYFGRVGNQSTGSASMYSGDETAIFEQSKIDQIAQADNEYQQYLSNND